MDTRLSICETCVAHTSTHSLWQGKNLVDALSRHDSESCMATSNLEACTLGDSRHTTPQLKYRRVIVALRPAAMRGKLAPLILCAVQPPARTTPLRGPCWGLILSCCVVLAYLTEGASPQAQLRRLP